MRVKSVGNSTAVVRDVINPCHFHSRSKNSPCSGRPCPCVMSEDFASEGPAFSRPIWWVWRISREKWTDSSLGTRCLSLTLIMKDGVDPSMQSCYGGVKEKTTLNCFSFLSKMNIHPSKLQSFGNLVHLWMLRSLYETHLFNLTGSIIS